MAFSHKAKRGKKELKKITLDPAVFIPFTFSREHINKQITLEGHSNPQKIMTNQSNVVQIKDCEGIYFSWLLDMNSSQQLQAISKHVRRRKHPPNNKLQDLGDKTEDEIV